ncbi:hypothetical protein ES288_D10G251600v1 [Gossypium darwinii]|uniref:Uncharacterized protein n=1 Tax=Gossypium darwinii TaxID=34276 RepID=A0A5D2B433_GOSDA|nr:hypothetical protein ES288_D10G251600v1 [Gossypium darwinii]
MPLLSEKEGNLGRKRRGKLESKGEKIQRKRSRGELRTEARFESIYQSCEICIPEKKRLEMENSSSSSELQKLIEAIKISEVVEGHTELIAKVADLHLSEQSDVKSLAESLIVCDLYCGGGADAEKCSLSYFFVKREKYILDNLGTLLQEKDIQADLVCCLQHLQLRFETEDKARRLLSVIFVETRGLFLGITLEKVFAKNCCFWICVFSFFFLMVTTAPVSGR